MQWMMLQQDQPKDYVIATGQQYSVREFVARAAARLGITMRWEGEGIAEIGIVEKLEGDDLQLRVPAIKEGQTIVRVDPRYFRPAEVETLLGDASKARAELGWENEISFEEMVEEMVECDLLAARQHAMIRGVNW